MPNKYIYSKLAANDISKIYKDTVTKSGAVQANKYDVGLEKTVQLLANNPDIGRMCDGLKLNYHRHEYGRHIIFYRKRKKDIFIIRILYDAMDVKGYF